MRRPLTDRLKDLKDDDVHGPGKDDFIEDFTLPHILRWSLPDSAKVSSIMSLI